MTTPVRLAPGGIARAAVVFVVLVCMPARAIPVAGQGEMVVPANGGQQRPPLSRGIGFPNRSGIPNSRGAVIVPPQPTASPPTSPALFRPGRVRSRSHPTRPRLPQRKGRSGRTLVIASTRLAFETINREFVRTGIRCRPNGPDTVIAALGRRRLTLACVLQVVGPDAGRMRQLLDQVLPENVLVIGTAGSLDPRVRPGALVLAERIGGSQSLRSAWLLADRPLLLEGRRIAARLQGNLEEDPSAMAVTGGLVAQFRPAMSPPASSTATYRLVAADSHVVALSEICGVAEFPFLPIVGISHCSGAAGAAGDAPRFATVAADRAARFTTQLLRQFP